jgi:hypothetical protein
MPGSTAGKMPAATTELVVGLPAKALQNNLISFVDSHLHAAKLTQWLNSESVILSAA